MNVQPVYALALVAFIGGANFGISTAAGQGGYGGGDVGWFPLGPREVYVPAYAASPGYVQRVNTSNTVVNTTTITNLYNTYNNQTTNVTTTNITYVNRTVPGAVTAVPQSAIRDSAPVARVAVPVDVRKVASAPVAPGASHQFRQAFLERPLPPVWLILRLRLSTGRWSRTQLRRLRRCHLLSSNKNWQNNLAARYPCSKPAHRSNDCRRAPGGEDGSAGKAR